VQLATWGPWLPHGLRHSSTSRDRSMAATAPYRGIDRVPHSLRDAVELAHAATSLADPVTSFSVIRLLLELRNR
jgi:hypothetical protein